MCCAEWFAQDAQFWTMPKFSLGKTCANAVAQVLTPELTTSSHHIPEEAKKIADAR